MYVATCMSQSPQRIGNIFKNQHRNGNCSRLRTHPKGIYAVEKCGFPHSVLTLGYRFCTNFLQTFINKEVHHFSYFVVLCWIFRNVCLNGHVIFLSKKIDWFGDYEKISMLVFRLSILSRNLQSASDFCPSFFDFVFTECYSQ